MKYLKFSPFLFLSYTFVFISSFFTTLKRKGGGTEEGRDWKDASFIKLHKSLHPTSQGEVSSSVFFLFYLFILPEEWKETSFSNSLHKD